ncbi:unnamed protein product [Boreogadus saida]
MQQLYESLSTQAGVKNTTRAEAVETALDKERCRNWVSSPLPLDAPVDAMLPDCPRFSAGSWGGCLASASQH